MKIEQKILDKITKFRHNKIHFVAMWIFANVFLAYILILINGFFNLKGYLLISIGFYWSIYFIFKSVIAIFNHVEFHLFRKYKIVKNR